MEQINIANELSKKYDLHKPFNYIINTSGKNTRGLFIKYIQNLLNNDRNTLTNQIIKDIDFCHNSSLIIDDIQDNSQKRRGKQCAHLVYNTGLCINSGYMKCFETINNINYNYPVCIRNEATKITLHYFVLMHTGQGLDIEWTTSKIIPELDEFNKMIDYKTGSAFLTSVELCILTTYNNTYQTEYNKEVFLELATKMGRFFQIRDDYINLTCPNYWKNKGFCEDFDEKKVSFIFTLMKYLNKDDTSFDFMHSKNKLTENEKITLYTHLFNENILHKTYAILDEYKKNIIELELKITKKTDKSDFLSYLFEKLNYNVPIHPNKIKQALI